MTRPKLLELKKEQNGIAYVERRKAHRENDGVFRTAKKKKKQTGRGGEGQRVLRNFVRGPGVAVLKKGNIRRVKGKLGRVTIHGESGIGRKNQEAVLLSVRRKLKQRRKKFNINGRRG